MCKSCDLSTKTSQVGLFVFSFFLTDVDLSACVSKYKQINKCFVHIHVENSEKPEKNALVFFMLCNDAFAASGFSLSTE